MTWQHNIFCAPQNDRPLASRRLVRQVADSGFCGSQLVIHTCVTSSAPRIRRIETQTLQGQGFQGSRDESRRLFKRPFVKGGEGGLKNWLVVEPTQLKNMLVKMGSSSPSSGENKK